MEDESGCSVPEETSRLPLSRGTSNTATITKRNGLYDYGSYVKPEESVGHIIPIPIVQLEALRSATMFNHVSPHVHVAIPFSSLLACPLQVTGTCCHRCSPSHPQRPTPARQPEIHLVRANQSARRKAIASQSGLAGRAWAPRRQVAGRSCAALRGCWARFSVPWSDPRRGGASHPGPLTDIVLTLLALRSRFFQPQPACWVSDCSAAASGASTTVSQLLLLRREPALAKGSDDEFLSSPAYGSTSGSTDRSQLSVSFSSLLRFPQGAALCAVPAAVPPSLSGVCCTYSVPSQHKQLFFFFFVVVNLFFLPFFFFPIYDQAVFDFFQPALSSFPPFRTFVVVDQSLFGTAARVLFLFLAYSPGWPQPRLYTDIFFYTHSTPVPAPFLYPYSQPQTP
ncbi:hypothetical protein CCMA1212_006043 [Trichoderma ghanense]|uniref:Uncharacterized protein n=1 Tax=Trichoderma ghanense TaxID=65468 RepID=A0ABY2H2R5_9HYPO